MPDRQFAAVPQPALGKVRLADLAGAHRVAAAVPVDLAHLATVVSLYPFFTCFFLIL